MLLTVFSNEEEINYETTMKFIINLKKIIRDGIVLRQKLLPLFAVCTAFTAYTTYTAYTVAYMPIFGSCGEVPKSFLLAEQNFTFQ